MRAFLLSLIEQRFWLPCYASLALGLWLPGDLSACKAAVPWLVGTILFFTCLMVALGDLRSQAMRPGGLLRAGSLVGMKLLLVPLLLWAALRPMAGEWAAGLALVSLMPAGMSSAAFASLLGGNLHLALLLVVGCNLLCPLSVPLGMELIGAGPAGGWDALGLAQRGGYLLLIVMVPFALAQGLRAALPQMVERHRHAWRRLAMAALITLIFVGVSSNRAAWAGQSFSQLLVGTAWCTLASAVFLGVSLLVVRRLGHSDGVAFGCGLLYMNNGLGLAYATAFYADRPLVLLPCILMQVPMVGMVSLLGHLAPRLAAGQGGSASHRPSPGHVQPNDATGPR